ncbi:MEMAR_RS02690 family S-layer glycoprotein [Methanoregula sp.]|uniref:MEMAR_RS02690 family S-layer glycoprotein n=1 Tax=Methanoregula sp. TaxID=2052170 RepID=UPI003C73B27E
MTKRLTIALVAVALFVLLAVMPAAAVSNGTVINQGATIFIGEQGLNVTHALNQANAVAAIDSVPTLTSIGWWASAAAITTTAPSQTVNLAGQYSAFSVAQQNFVGYTGNWYLLTATGQVSQHVVGTPDLVFVVADPALDIGVWDYNQATDVTGTSVPQGENLGFTIKTNMVMTGTLRSDLIYNNAIAINASETNSGLTGFSTDSTGVWSNGTTPATVFPITYTNTSYASGWVTTYGYAPTSISTGVATFSGAATFTGPVYTVATATPSTALNPATDGFINLKIKDQTGATLTGLINASGSPSDVIPLINQYVNQQPFYWPFNVNNGISYWKTDALNANSQYAYPVGTYTVWAESALNNMKDNYKNSGADYTGKTISQTYTISLVSSTVKIEANQDSVVRSKSFSVTITGKPSTPYYLWVKGTSSMDSTYDNQAPSINANQNGVFQDPAVGVVLPNLTVDYPIGDYQYQNGAHKSIRQDVATDAVTGMNATEYYALVNTSTDGTATVGWVTTNWTKAQQYTIRVEQNFPISTSGYGSGYQAAGSSIKSDEVDINVQKGAVTIVAAGDQSYYLGEEIDFSGTNTESYQTYLYIIGPNLPTNGAQIQNSDPRNNKVVDGDASTFEAVSVNGDNTWSWKWGTSNYALDAGTYTIYATSQPNDASDLQNTAYGTVSIIIKKPFVSATASQSTVAKGDNIFITGTAEGQPSAVAVWILGKNYAQRYTTAVNSDASFSYEIKQEVTKTLASGQYFVVVQHPMQNNIFDVDLDTNTASSTYGYVINRKLQAQGGTGTATAIFQLLGAGSLQGSDAAEALAVGIDNANVDDTYTKLQFLVEEPVIQIDSIGDKHVGDKFTITAATNLAVDDEILVQIYSSSFKPTDKSQSGEFSGATGTVKVTQGSSGMNLISFDVDSSTFKPDEYIVTESAVIQDATGTALFNVLETSATTVAPTSVVTVAPTTMATEVPTTMATAIPTTVPTKSPGFGALIALIGLGAVAFVVVRRH